MSLVRVQTTWNGVGGAPYYTNLYAIGPLSTNNGNDLADAWRVFLTSCSAFLCSGLIATIDPELLEFDETTGAVISAGNTIQTPVAMGFAGDQLPHSQQALIRWQTNGIVHNRRVRGRTFIPGAVEVQNSATGTPTTALTAPLQTAANALLTTMSGRLRVWAQPFKGSTDPDKPNPPRPGSHHEIRSAQVADYWAILRSRRD